MRKLACALGSGDKSPQSWKWQPAAAGVPPDVKEYPNAGHSFLNNHHNVLFKMLKVTGIGCHGPSAQDARRRIVSFFNTHLKS